MHVLDRRQGAARPDLGAVRDEQTVQGPLRRVGAVHSERESGTAGFPLPGRRVRVDEGGQLQVAGPTVFRGYLYRGLAATRLRAPGAVLFTSALWAMLMVGLVIFVTGLPISYYAAKMGVDIDLLTRGAGFGYLGSTITSLIYAAFTFIFFAIEAAILAMALKALFGIPLPIGYVICALAVIPIVTHGIATISRFQVGSHGIWLDPHLRRSVGVRRPRNQHLIATVMR